MLDGLRGLFRRKSAPIAEAAPKRALPLASAALLVGGAGVAFWWYTQWAHGRSDGDGAPDETAIGTVTPVVPQSAEAALNESLAVQADAVPPTSAGTGET